MDSGLAVISIIRLLYLSTMEFVILQNLEFLIINYSYFLGIFTISIITFITIRDIPLTM